MPSTDRRAIAPMLSAFFPTMALAKSDEWHGFLNEQTGLAVDIDEPNATAFDKWRAALEAQGLPVWGVTQTRRDAIAAKGAELKAAEETRREALGKTLEQLAREAPDVAARDLLK